MTTPAIEQVDPATLRKVIVAAGIGNFVEWFDFAVYGFLATTIAQQFFPSGDASAALLKTFAVFAVAFAFRPLGGLFFGMLGDKIGRKRTLAFTILLMAGATTIIGLLPTYAAIGVTAPILLTIIRCAQGFSAGGEYAGACAYLMEHAPRGKRAWYGSFVPVSTFAAFAAAAIFAYALEASLSTEAMSSWGWRLPFLVAAPLGLVGLYLRWKMDETPAFQAVAEEHAVAHSPLKETLRNHGAAICALGAFISLTALSFYMFTTYFATYLQVAGGLSRATALLVSLLALLFAAVMCPVAGAFSDRVGRRATVVTACVLLAVMVYPSFLMASSGSFVRFDGRRVVARDGRSPVQCGHCCLVVGNLSYAHALHRFSDHLQHGLHHFWRNCAVDGNLADWPDRQQSGPGVLLDRDCSAGADRRPGVAGDVQGVAA
jgi:MHS family proline/betaine transporter-like MFS transporter